MYQIVARQSQSKLGKAKSSPGLSRSKLAHQIEVRNNQSELGKAKSGHGLRRLKFGLTKLRSKTTNRSFSKVGIAKSGQKDPIEDRISQIEGWADQTRTLRA